MEPPLRLDSVLRKLSFGAACCRVVGCDRRLAKQLGLNQDLFDFDVHAVPVFQGGAMGETPLTRS